MSNKTHFVLHLLIVIENMSENPSVPNSRIAAYKNFSKNSQVSFALFLISQNVFN